jgi:hypothetical protein
MVIPCEVIAMSDVWQTSKRGRVCSAPPNLTQKSVISFRDILKPKVAILNFVINVAITFKLSKKILIFMCSVR